MKCSICKIEGHKANNKKIHPVNKIPTKNNSNVKVDSVEKIKTKSINFEITDAKYNIDVVVKNLYEYIISKKDEKIIP